MLKVSSPHSRPRSSVLNNESTISRGSNQEGSGDRVLSNESTGSRGSKRCRMDTQESSGLHRENSDSSYGTALQSPGSGGWDPAMDDILSPLAKLCNPDTTSDSESSGAPASFQLTSRVIGDMWSNHEGNIYQFYDPEEYSASPLLKENSPETLTFGSPRCSAQTETNTHLTPESLLDTDPDFGVSPTAKKRKREDDQSQVMISVDRAFDAIKDLKISFCTEIRDKYKVADAEAVLESFPKDLTKREWDTDFVATYFGVAYLILLTARTDLKDHEYRDGREGQDFFHKAQNRWIKEAGIKPDTFYRVMEFLHGNSDAFATSRQAQGLGHAAKGLAETRDEFELRIKIQNHIFHKLDLDFKQKGQPEKAEFGSWLENFAKFLKAYPADSKPTGNVFTCSGILPEKPLLKTLFPVEAIKRNILGAIDPVSGISDDKQTGNLEIVKSFLGYKVEDNTILINKSKMKKLYRYIMNNIESPVPGDR